MRIRLLPAVAAIALPLTAFGCSDRPEVADDQEDSVDIGVLDQEVGDCLEDTGSIVVFDLPVVGCDVEHEAEVVGLVEVGDADEYDSDAVYADAIDRCLTEFEGYVGAPLLETNLIVDALTPTETGWDAGDRGAICIAVTRDESTLSQSVEDAADDFAAVLDDALATSRDGCLGGDDAACLDLFNNSAEGSDDEWIARFCGGRDFTGTSPCLTAS